MSGSGDRRRRAASLEGAHNPENHSASSTPPRLLERDVLLSELRTLFSAGWTRPTGAVVLEGRSGVGKSALLGAACQIAADAGWAEMRATADTVQATSAFGVLRQLLASHNGPGHGERVETLKPDALAAKLETVTRKLAAEPGVVFAIDDAQWVDEESSDWLFRVTRAPAHPRIRLVLGVLARSPGTPLRPIERIVSEASSRVMPLGALSVDGVSTLARDYFGEPPEPAFVRACYEATGGNPFLLLSLFRELSLEQLEPVAGSVPSLQTITSSSVARWVLSRLARMPPESARLLEAVAVANAPLDLDLAVAATKLDPVKAGASAEGLIAIDLLARERPLRFLHPLVRRTVLAEIPARRRARLHAAIARELKARGAPLVQLAEHLLDAETGRDDWVATSLEQAGNIALSHGATEDAMRYLSRALAEHPSARGRPELLLSLARAEAPLDGLPALEHLRSALEQGATPAMAARAALDVIFRVADPAVRAEFGPVLGGVASLLGESDAGVKIELLVASALVTRQPAVVLAAADSLRGLIGTRRGYPTATERRGIGLIAIVDAKSATRARTVEVAALARRALNGPEFVSNDPLDSELWARAILSLAYSCEFDEADRQAIRAQTLSRSQYLVVAEAEYSASLARSLALQGAIVEAEEHVRSGLSLMEGRPWARRPDAHGVLLSVLVDGGRLEEAEMLLSELSERELEPSSLEAHHLLEQCGRLRIAQGRWSDALDDLTRAGRWADDSGTDNPAVSVWRSEAALAFAGAGHDDEATGLAEDNLELARAHGGDWVVGSALHVLASVCVEQRRLSLLEEAVGLLDGSGAMLRLAGALIDLGRVLRESGSISRARQALRRGADLAFQSRAAPLLASAMTELRLSGARPRRVALTGTEALTSSERRVVALAAMGLTNSEVASELHIVEKTVEGHLVRAFRKLGVRSRRQLATMLEHDGSRDEGVR